MVIKIERSSLKWTIEDGYKILTESRVEEILPEWDC